MIENEGLQWLRRQLKFEAFMTALQEKAATPAAGSKDRPPELAEPVSDTAEQSPRVAVEAT